MKKKLNAKAKVKAWAKKATKSVKRALPEVLSGAKMGAYLTLAAMGLAYEPATTLAVAAGVILAAILVD